MTTKVGDVRVGMRSGIHWRVTRVYNNGSVDVEADIPNPERNTQSNNFEIEIFERWKLVRRGEPNLSKFALWQRKVA